MKGIGHTVEPICLGNILVATSKKAQHPQANQKMPDDKRLAPMLEKQTDSLYIYGYACKYIEIFSENATLGENSCVSKYLYN